MNFTIILILTFCAHHVFSQENVRDRYESAKSPRRVQDGEAVNTYNNNQGFSRQIVTVEDTPDEFIIKRPTQNNPGYNDFLNYLYRNDKAKSKSKREITDVSIKQYESRSKRAIIFRPLFVYRQQEVRRQRVEEEKRKTKKPLKPTKKPSKQG